MPDINTLLTLAAIIAGIFVYWRKGGNTAASELLAVYKARDDMNDKTLTEIKGQLQTQQSEIGRLKGIIEEKDKRIIILEDIAKNRNPEMTKFMEYLTKVAAESEKRMAKGDEITKSLEQLPSILGEIRMFMEQMNEHFAEHTVTAGSSKV